MKGDKVKRQRCYRSSFLGGIPSLDVTRVLAFVCGSWPRQPFAGVSRFWPCVFGTSRVSFVFVYDVVETR